MRHFAKCQKDLDVCSDLCLFTSRPSRANMCLGFCCSVWEGSFESGQEGRNGGREGGGGKATVSLFHSDPSFLFT